jgi:predicted exporter
LNLFGVLGLVLVLGIGIDYTLFMAECREKPVSTLLAVSLSAATTLLSFGLLSLSQTTAIQTFGLVVLVGIFIAFILAPTACDCPHEGPGPDDCVKHDIS